MPKRLPASKREPIYDFVFGARFMQTNVENASTLTIRAGSSHSIANENVVSGALGR
jgi:hypothetical protein